ncbi:uncharacterized protein PHALS_02611 [Plasmopara halstedii]|uniref:WRKY19-like zinc finger domain-containing protein n=1 Tax=Plasmopara halstedii TaxID=4781 RepID=A0A0P1AV47_PLAHL|nr:uncharacterized protein PHALS_02611 [Plasmopara halstedii]CEG46196.1 hypothetical protein PHALS_02611 [Plasmopara halstedii]|eukprot:XP_024582565.1 hypothetical protein PHALS_02611 [Plasmopara halstedii]
MGLPETTSDDVNNDGQQCWRQWEPDHEPPTDDKPDLQDETCATSDGPYLASSRPILWPLSNGGVSNNTLAPLNHHNQLTRFMAKQALGYIPKLKACSPDRTALPTFQLPRIGTPPLSPQKWASPSPFVSQEKAEGGRPSLPALGSSTGSFIQRSSSFSESCVSPIPPLKLQYQETTHHTMSIADLCQPFRYMRAASCPSDTNPPKSAPTTPQPNVDKTWRPTIESLNYPWTQRCCGDAEISHRDQPRTSSLVENECQPKRLERSSSVDAPTLMRHLKRTAAESIDLTQWLDHPGRNSLLSLADSADSMYQLEQAGRSMRISDSPRSDPVTPHEAKREKKLCAFPQCASNAVTRGLCISHGGGRRCQRKGCTRGAQSKGLCVAHGGGRICRAAGCSNIQRSMGLCIRHGGGRRCSIKGCQKGVVRQDLCTAHGGKRKCRVPECTKHVKKKGLCRAHANSMYTTSSPQ